MIAALPAIPLLPLYVITGAVAGVGAGMLGIGGGIIIVPALVFLFQLQGIAPQVIMHLAVATSLATIIFTSLSSAWSHQRRGAVLWPAVGALVPGILLGAVAGGLIADRLSGHSLRLVFGVFECLIAVQIGWGRRPQPQRRLPGIAGMSGAGALIGALSTVLGIGGGAMIVPFLHWCNINIRNAVATSAACGFPIALAGTASLVAAGWAHPDTPPGTTGYVYWPAALLVAAASVFSAPLGARFAHSLPTLALRRVFAVFLAVVGIRMLMRL